MKKTMFLGRLTAVLSAILIVGTSMVALGDPIFTFTDTGSNSVELKDVFPDGGDSLSVPSKENDKSVESIAAAFSSCVDVRDISIPESVMAIAPTAFEGCVSLINIRVDEGNQTYSDRDGVLCDVSGEVLLLCPAGRSGTFVIPAGVKSVAAGAFAGCASLTKIIVPPSISASASAIGANVFADCTQLSSLAVPQNFSVDMATLGLPAGCTVLRYQPGALDDPFLPPRWAVSFNANGGTGTMADQVFSSGVAAKLRANAFKRASYTFAGWALSANGAVVYKNGQSVVNIAAAGQCVTLYAKWVGVPYTVVFHEKNKGGKTVSQKLVYGTATALRKNTFKKSGYVFMGWAKKPGGSVAYKDKATVSGLATKSGAKVNLYSRWAVKNYTVRFDANGGKGRMADQRFVYGTSRRLRANAFKRTGYTFTGWARKPSAAVKYKNRQALSTLTSKGGTVVFYAKWKRNRYTVVFDANGATGSMADQPQQYDKKAQLPSNTFKYSGHVFMGWAKSKEGEVKYKNRATVKNLSSRDGAIVRLFARWAVKNYSVRFIANGGTGTMDDEAFVYGAAAKALSKNAFTNGDQIFLGWARSATAKKPEFSDGETIRNLTEAGGVVTLYAIWQKLGDPNIVLCLGDSITEGYRCSGLPYPSRLAQLSGRTVRNYGKGGKLASYGASIAEDALRRENPGIVCILFGANDAIHHVSSSVTKENLRKIIRLCRKYNAKPIIATPTPQIGSHARFNSGVKSIASQVRSLAREENVALVDLYSAFGDGSKYLNPADGLHLSDAGGSLMAREFYKAF
jgi:uncharacterized repeat protein (TIGR02543 family)